MSDATSTGRHRAAAWRPLHARTGPTLHNAFDEALIAELTAALRRRRRREATCAWSCWPAPGKSFSAGADLNWMRRMAGYREDANRRRRARRWRGMLQRASTAARSPTIARVHGAAYRRRRRPRRRCDIAVAASAAQFATHRGAARTVPAVISPVRRRARSARAGRGAASCTGERFAAARARRDRPGARGRRRRPSSTPRVAALVGELLAAAARRPRPRQGAGRRWSSGMPQVTAHRAAGHRATHRRRGAPPPKGRKGMAAFLDKRTPAWRRGLRVRCSDRS